MVKISIDSWEVLKCYIQRISEAEISPKIIVNNAEIELTDEEACSLLDTKQLESEGVQKKYSVKRVNTTKVILGYFQKNPMEILTRKEIARVTELTESQVNNAITKLLESKDIERVNKDKYKLAFQDKEFKGENNETQEQPKEPYVWLKQSYQIGDCHKIIDYIYSKNEVYDNNLKTYFEKCSEEVTEIIRKSKILGFIIEEKGNKDIRYVVSNVARIWYILLNNKENMYMKDILNKAIALSDRQAMEAIKKGEELNIFIKKGTLVSLA